MPASWRDRVSHEQFCCISYNSVIVSTIPSLLGLYPVCRSLGLDARERKGRGITARWRGTSEQETTELWERVCIGACRGDDNCALVQCCTLIGKEKCSRSLT
jgi:hypothetical protein